MTEKKDVLILAIESSCDETAASVVKNGREVRLSLDLPAPIKGEDNVFVQYIAEENGEEASLEGFLEEVALVSEVDKYDEGADAVVLMTVHSAKGLEFPIVFLPGMEENIFPSSQIRTDPGELGEERRLAYVAITRAKEKIYNNTFATIIYILFHMNGRPLLVSLFIIRRYSIHG